MEEKLKQISTELNDSYRVNKEFARGGMGVVYQVFDKKLKRNLAMKLLLAENENDQMEAKRAKDYFEEEALLTAQLEHPNIVPVHDLGRLSDQDPYFTMKMVHGESLKDIIENLANDNEDYIKKYSLIQRLMIFRKVCDALAFSHSHKVIHRDIKPENIMVGDYGEVLLMDWGLAKYLGQENGKPGPLSGKELLAIVAEGRKEREREEERDFDFEQFLSESDDEEDQPEDDGRIHSLRANKDFSKTSQGDIWGTPWYISPEQLKETEPIDQQSDIYLLGGTLYHLITFYPPHLGNTIEELVQCCLKGKIVPPQKCNPQQQIPSELQMIVMRALALEKEDRYQSVSDLTADLDAFIAGEIAHHPVKFKKGETIIRQGDKGNEAYVILKGEVEVYQEKNDKKYHLADIGPGNVVGEMAIISSRQRLASVIAKKDTEVLIINRQRMQEVLQKSPPWLEKIILNLVDRLRDTVANFHPLLLGERTYHILHQFTYCLLAASAFQNKCESLETLEFQVDQIVKQISEILCIPLDKVQPTFDRFLATRACEKTGRNSFKIKDFSLLCHILNNVHRTLKMDITLPFPVLPKADNVIKSMAAEISQNLLVDESSRKTEQRFTLRKKIMDIFRI